MDGDTVHVGIVDEPDDLVGEQFRVILAAVEIRLRGFGRVQLEPLADTLAQHMARRVRSHDLRHRLLDERLETRELVTER